MTALEAAAINEPRPRLDLGRVVRRTFGAIGANFVTFILLAIVFAAIPSALIGFASGYLSAALMTQFGYSNFQLMASLVALGSMLLTAIPSYILVGALTQGSITYYNGSKASFNECAATGFKLLLSLVGLALATIVGLAVWVLPTMFLGVLLSGFIGAITYQTDGAIIGVIAGIAFLVAGLTLPAMAAIRWAVTAPVLVTERTGVMDAFTRSGTLTRNNRWAIFFLALIWVVISAGIQWTVRFIATSAIVSMQDAYATAAMSLFVFNVIYSALTNLILASGQAALYYELRVLKEGATSDELAKVFD